MGKFLTRAALVVALASSASAPAQDRSAFRDDRTAVVQGPQDPLATGDDLFRGAAGVRLAAAPHIREDGSTERRKGFVGSWSVARDARLGVGLFSVDRYSRGEGDFKRLQPIRDVGGKDQKIAAVGLSIGF